MVKQVTTVAILWGFFGILWGFFVAGSQPSSAQDNTQSLASTILRPSVVSVTAYDEQGGTLSCGSGFFVTETGNVITKRSLLPQKMSNAKIGTSDGETFDVVKIDKEDKEAGIVCISTDARLGAVRTLRVSVSVPSIGEKVFIINGNAPADQAVTEATVLATQGSPVGIGIELSASLSQNSEGSPVVNLRGDVVGMVNQIREGEQTFVAIPSARIALLYPNRSGNNPHSAIRETRPPATIEKPGGVLQGLAITRLAPQYPMFAKKAHVSGSVVVEVVVDEEGKVVSARAIRANLKKPQNMPDEEAKRHGEDLKKASEEAARQWKFTPTTAEGKPVKVVGTITFNFHL